MVIIQKLQAIWMFSFIMIGTDVLELVQFSQKKHFLHSFTYTHNNFTEHWIL